MNKEKKKQKDEEPGTYLASASRDKTIKIWDTRTALCVLTLVGHDNWVRDVVWHPNGKYLVSVADDKSIKVWDLLQGRCIKTIEEAHDHFVACLDLSSNAGILVTGGVDNHVKIWNCT